MAERITLKHIAKTLSLSISTVSKSLNDSHEISIETKKIVREFADKNNYKPNKYALKLRSNQSKTIGVIVPNILNSFFTKIFAGIEKEVDKSGYTLVIYLSNESYEKEKNITKLIKNDVLDGVMLSVSKETEDKGDYRHIESLINYGIPIVLFDRVPSKISCDKVIVDDEDAAFNATIQLLNSGCKKISIISSINTTSVGKLRIKGYKRALLKHQISKKQIFNITDNELSNDVESLIINKKTDAILFLNEGAAIMCLKFIKKNNLKIPADISIISFTDGEIQKNTTPTITSIDQHAEDIGKITAITMLHRINNKLENNITKVIKTSLIKRESTKNNIYHIT